MKHYGDVSKISGSQIEPVDIITFGSPCQDLSVAGKREGMKHAEQGDEETTRSGLFYEAIRIIEEMREATNGEYPKYAVWENVPGAFSSNKGRDFHAVLEAFCSVCDDTVSIPEPYDRKRTKLIWNKAGEIVGVNYSVAWRTLDAQYWGVPQRRKRIYLVADFTGRRAGKILFKPESLRGDMSQGDEAGQKVTADAVGGVDGGVGAAGFLSTQGSKAMGIGFAEEQSPTLRAGLSGADVVYSFDSTSVGGADGSSGNGGQLAATVISSYGTKWNGNAGAYNGENFVLHKQDVDGSVGAECLVLKERAGCAGGGKGALWSDKAFTLATNQDMSVIALQANGIDRADTAGCNGCGWRENESYTLNTIDRHAVCYGIDHVITTGGNCTAQGSCVYEHTQATLKAGGVHAVCFEPGAMVRDMGNRIWTEQSPTLRAKMGDNQPAVTMQRSDEYQKCNVASTQSARQYKSATDLVVEKKRKYIIRRLTPTECARLQGFPDWWSTLAPYNPADAEFWEDVRKTHAEINGKKYKPVKDIKKWYEKLHTDSAEYKMWGNGIALPNAEYVMHGVASQGAKTLGSLFDGSGGFPLAGAMNGIKPLWASEVEPYPIAVTKSRFKEEQE